MRRTLLAFLPLSLWAVAVFVVGGLEEVPAPRLPPGSDKVAHFVMYGVGGALAAWAGSVRGGRAGRLSLLFVIVLGALDEVRQATLTVARQGDVWDWVADAAGAIFFYLIAALILQRR